MRFFILSDVKVILFKGSLIVILPANRGLLLWTKQTILQLLTVGSRLKLKSTENFIDPFKIALTTKNHNRSYLSGH